jgi:hypothetical protein
MIGLAAGTQIWIVAGVTDMRRGFVGLLRRSARLSQRSEYWKFCLPDEISRIHVF